MIVELTRRAMFGIGFSGIFTFITLTILNYRSIEASIAEVWLHMLASLVIGIYFGIASLIFDYDEWSPLKQIVLHFLLSSLVFFPIATLLTGWIPLQLSSIVIGICMFVLTYGVCMTVAYLYFKKQEEELNRSVRTNNRE